MADSTPSAKSTGSGVSRLTSSPASSTSSVVSVARSPKTRVVRIDDGFDFLGHTIVRRVKRGTSKTYVFTFPSAKAMQAIRNRTSELTTSRSTLYMALDEVLLRLSRSFGGWANYFRHGSSSRHFQQVDYHAWKRI